MSVAVGLATVLDLDDMPDDVVIRDAVRNVVGDAGIEALYPLTDPRYDVPTNGRPAGAIAKLPAASGSPGDSEAFDETLTKAQASERIDALQHKTGRGEATR